MGNDKAALPTFEKAFESASKALSNQSKSQRVFSTTLHVSKDYKWGLKDYLHGYFIHGHYSGFYPIEGDLERASKKYFNVIRKYDASVDYQYSSIACPNHFGNFKIEWTLKKIFLVPYLFIVNPFIFATWLYHICGSWMWHFGGLEIVPEAQRPSKTLWYFYEKVR